MTNSIFEDVSAYRTVYADVLKQCQRLGLRPTSASLSIKEDDICKVSMEWRSSIMFRSSLEALLFVSLATSVDHTSIASHREWKSEEWCTTETIVSFLSSDLPRVLGTLKKVKYKLKDMIKERTGRNSRRCPSCERRLSAFEGRKGKGCTNAYCKHDSAWLDSLV